MSRFHNKLKRLGTMISKINQAWLWYSNEWSLF